MSRLDAHIHLFDRGFHGDRGPGDELAQYERLRRLHSIDAAVVIGYEGPGFEGNNESVLHLARTSPWIVPFVYLHLPPRDARADTRADAQWEHVCGQVATARARGARGLALYLDAQGSGLADAPPGFTEAVNLAGLPISVNAPAEAWRHAGGWLSHVEVPVLISHLGLPGAGSGPDPARATEALQPVLALTALPNVLIKLSGAYAIDPIAPHVGASAVVSLVLDAFGADRVCWGSDFSPALDAVDESHLFALPAGADGLDADALHAILSGTLARVLGGTP